MSYTPSYKDVSELLKKDGIMPNESILKSKESLLDKLGNAAGEFNQKFESAGIPNFAAGLLSAPQKTAVNIANLPHDLGLGTPKVNLPDYLNPSSASSLPDTPFARMMGKGGEFLGDALTGGAAYNGLSKLSKINATSSLAQRALLGATAGGVTASSDQPGGRLGAAAIGGALPVAVGITKNAIGKKAGELAATTENKFNNLYNKFFNKAAKEADVTNLPLTNDLNEKSKTATDMFRHLADEYTPSVKEFFKKPTLENAHNAQSDLGKFIRNFKERRIRGETLSSSEQKTYHAAQKVRNEIKNSIHDNFSESRRPDLSREYKDITHAYAKENAPLKTTELAKYLGGKGSAKKVAEQLLESTSFKDSAVSGKIPGYEFRHAIRQLPPGVKNMMPYLIGSAAGSAGIGIPGYWYLSKIMENK